MFENVPDFVQWRWRIFVDAKQRGWAIGRSPNADRYWIAYTEMVQGFGESFKFRRMGDPQPMSASSAQFMIKDRLAKGYVESEHPLFDVKWGFYLESAIRVGERLDSVFLSPIKEMIPEEFEDEEDACPIVIAPNAMAEKGLYLLPF